MESKDIENPMFKHSVECHPDLQMTFRDFQMTVLGHFPCPILGQSMEGTFIARAVDHRAGGANIVLLNSKSEFFHPGTVRESYRRDLD